MEANKIFELRKADADDAVQIESCLRAAYAPHLQSLAGLPDVAGDVAEEIRTHRAWVAVKDRQVIGVLILSDVQSDEVHLVNLAVDPAQQGIGLGTYLVQTAQNIALEDGATRLVLGTHTGMSATIAFYERHGFCEFARDGVKLILQKLLKS